jgi:glucose-1-phosphate cytidylyltransferase
MKCIILAGGYGTRIRDVSDNVPKPMIPIGSYPILWHIMKHYARYGHRDFVVCLGYRGSVIKEFFVNYEAHTRDFTITLGRLNAMTGCRIKRVQKYVQGN